MVKILRKYNKYVLVVGMSLLMIAFMIPSGIKQFSDPAHRAYAHLDGKKINVTDFGKVEREYRAIDRFSPTLTRAVLGIENPDHWLLLTHEAEQGGFVGEQGDGADWPLLESITARAIAEQQFGQLAQQVLQQPQYAQEFMEQAKKELPLRKHDAMGSLAIPEKDFNHALAKARGVYRMMESFQRAARFSDRRATLDLKSQLDAVFADCAIIPAERVAASIADPSEDEIKAHFEKYRTVKTGTGDVGIGYTLPARMKLEWLTLDRAAIEKAVKIDPVDANKRWRTNRAKYPGEFAAEKVNVERDMRAEKVTEVMEAADRLVRAELKKASGKLDSDKSYKKLPEDWAAKRPKLEAIALLVSDNIKATNGFDMPLPPVTVKAAQWLTIEDISALSDIGASSVRAGARSVPFPQAVFLVKELRGDQVQLTDFGLQTGLTSTDIVPVDNEGRRYFFTVLDVRRESPADTLEEIKSQVIIDIKKLKAYDTLLTKADSFKAAAVVGGIDAVAKAVDEQFPRPVEATPLPDGSVVKTLKNVVVLKEEVVRGDPRLNTKEFRNTVLAAAAKLDPTKASADVPASDRTFSDPLPQSLCLSIVQLVQNRPLTAEMNRRAADQAIAQIQGIEFRDAMAKMKDTPGPFSLKELTARLNYKTERAPGDDEEAPKPAAADAKSAATQESQEKPAK